MNRVARSRWRWVREPITRGYNLRQPPIIVVGWGIVRIVTTGTPPPGSDDAIGADMLPQLQSFVAAGLPRLVLLCDLPESVTRIYLTGAYCRRLWASASTGDSGSRPASKAKSNCGSAALNVRVSSRATGDRQIECPNVKRPASIGRLRVPPSLAATGSQEISPVLRALDPSRGCVTDIRRLKAMSSQSDLRNQPGVPFLGKSLNIVPTALMIESCSSRYRARSEIGADDSVDQARDLALELGQALGGAVRARVLYSSTFALDPTHVLQQARDRCGGLARTRALR
jgi:hypothetical protein